MKDLYNLQKQAKQIKQDLQNIHIQAEVNGVLVTMNGEMELVDLVIGEAAMAEGAIKLAKTIKEAVAKAKKKAEQIAAEKMKAVMGAGGMGDMLK